MAEAKPIAHLDFEKPLAELEKRIEELRKLSGKQKLGAEAEITSLQKKWASARQEVYGNLTPWQRIQIVRHPQRPLPSRLPPPRSHRALLTRGGSRFW